MSTCPRFCRHFSLRSSVVIQICPASRSPYPGGDGAAQLFTGRLVHGTRWHRRKADVNGCRPSASVSTLLVRLRDNSSECLCSHLLSYLKRHFTEWSTQAQSKNATRRQQQDFHEVHSSAATRGASPRTASNADCHGRQTVTAHGPTAPAHDAFFRKTGFLRPPL